MIKKCTYCATDGRNVAPNDSIISIFSRISLLRTNERLRGGCTYLRRETLQIKSQKRADASSPKWRSEEKHQIRPEGELVQKEEARRRTASLGGSPDADPLIFLAASRRRELRRKSASVRSWRLETDGSRAQEA